MPCGALRLAAADQRERRSATDRIDVPVDATVLAELESLSEFRRAYEPYGMTHDEFADFGASRNTLRQFLDAAAQLDALVRDVVVPAA